MHATMGTASVARETTVRAETAALIEMARGQSAKGLSCIKLAIKVMRSNAMVLNIMAVISRIQSVIVFRRFVGGGRKPVPSGGYAPCGG